MNRSPVQPVLRSIWFPYLVIKYSRFSHLPFSFFLFIFSFLFTFLYSLHFFIFLFWIFIYSFRNTLNLFSSPQHLSELQHPKKGKRWKEKKWLKDKEWDDNKLQRSSSIQRLFFFPLQNLNKNIHQKVIISLYYFNQSLLIMSTLRLASFSLSCLF